MSATPTVEAEISAIKTVMDAINPSVGTTYNGRHGFPSDVEFLVAKSLLGSGSFDLWFISCRRQPPFSGQARGQDYVRYEIEIEHWCQRTGLTYGAWDAACRAKDTAVLDAIAGNSSIYRISGQIPHETEEQPELESHVPDTLTAPDGMTPPKIFKSLIIVRTEARRFS